MSKAIKVGVEWDEEPGHPEFLCSGGFQEAENGNETHYLVPVDEFEKLLDVVRSVEAITCDGVVSWSLVTKEWMSEVWHKCAYVLGFYQDLEEADAPFGPVNLNEEEP